ncbi:MAG: PASTA domain-containing protein [Clostridiales bacterium]|jgi:stage V sporulation protein D (sporulation-specific penicillin-binding protein)|nr:PASTA domain-containing protein [Clostridiales bacterium]
MRWRKIRLFGLAVILMISLLMIKLGYIKVVYGDDYERTTVKQQVNTASNIEKTIPPGRGFILDRNRQQLAISAPIYNVIFDVKAFQNTESETQAKILSTVSTALDIDLGHLQASAYNVKNAGNQYLIIKRGINSELKNSLVKLIEKGVEEDTPAGAVFKLTTIYLEADTKREYVKNNFAPQVLGFIRGDSSWGLENSYGADMAGTPGRIFRRYDMYNTVITEENPAIPGKTIVTTLDARMQDSAQKAADNAASLYHPENASVIIMDPNTGEIFAMAQSPSFNSNAPGDPSGFTDEALKEIWPTLTEDLQREELYKLWGNFSLTRTFEPGSIFKPIVISAALEENIIDPDSIYYCGGHLQVADRDISCWIRSTGRIHGNQTLTQALANSCNVALMEIIDKLGRDLFYQYRNDFGFGEKTGIDLPGEASSSSSAVLYSLEQLNPVELATSSIGQGFNCTALQAVTAFAAVINGGNLLRPYVVSQVVDENNVVVKENTPSIIRKVISAETSSWMRTALNKVVTPEGTGKNAAIEGYSIGGKTGTAQQGAQRDEYTVSFIAYLPVEDPQYIVMALIDRPLGDSTGATSAAPMIKEVLEDIIEYKNIPPSSGALILDRSTNWIVVSDFTGKDLAEATRTLNSMALDYHISGSGNRVTGQFPSAGQDATPGSEIILYVETDGISEAELAGVPNVVGMSSEQAEAALRTSGFVPIAFQDSSESKQSDAEPVTKDYSDPEAADEAAPAPSSGIVYAQMPEPGIRVSRGVEVKIKIRFTQASEADSPS